MIDYMYNIIILKDMDGGDWTIKIDAVTTDYSIASLMGREGRETIRVDEMRIN